MSETPDLGKGSGEPQQPYQQPNPYQQNPYQQKGSYQPYGQAPYGAVSPTGIPYGPPPDHPQTTTVLILGILSFALCQVVAPFAWVMGKRALNEIDASGGRLGGRSQVQIGYVLGIVGSVILGLGVAYVLVVLVVLVGTA